MMGIQLIHRKQLLFSVTKCYTFLPSWDYNTIFGGLGGYCCKLTKCNNISVGKRFVFFVQPTCGVYFRQIYKKREDNRKKKNKQTKGLS